MAGTGRIWTALRVAFALAAVAAVVYGLLVESHVVKSFAGDEETKLGGPAFTEAVTRDAMIRTDDGLYDPNSLRPEGEPDAGCGT